MPQYDLQTGEWYSNDGIAMLSKIAPHGQVHTTVEYAGYRFYLGSDPRWYEAKARALAIKEKSPAAANFFNTDRDCSVNGDLQAYAKFIGVQL